MFKMVGKKTPAAGNLMAGNIQDALKSQNLLINNSYNTPNNREKMFAIKNLKQ
jgi:hypothetical protein